MRLLTALSLLLSASVSGAAEPGRLEVRGNRLLYDGKPVRLRGVSVGDPVRHRAFRPASVFAAVADYLRAHGK